MVNQTSVDTEKLKELNDRVYERGMIDREHLLDFLTYVKTNDQMTIVNAVKEWLQTLHDDPKYDKVVFPKNDINNILGDLDSYGRVQPETIMKFKEDSDRALS